MKQVLERVNAETIILTLHASMEMLKAHAKDHDQFRLEMDYVHIDEQIFIRYFYREQLLLEGMQDRDYGSEWTWSVHPMLAPYVNEQGVLNFPDVNLGDVAARFFF